MKVVLGLFLLGVWGYIMWWLLQGSRAQGRAKAFLLVAVMLILMALGVKF